MEKLSLCMIVKNEESILAKSLDSLGRVYDELIIVDTGSDDTTVEIARKYTDKVYFFDWIDDFAAARNYALGFCSNKYVITWDADYILPKASLRELQKLKKARFGNKNIVYCKWFTEYAENGDPTRCMWRELIFSRYDFEWASPIHNYLKSKPQKSSLPLNCPNLVVEHWKDPESKHHRYSQTEAILKKSLFENPTGLGSYDYNRLLLFYTQSLIHSKAFEKAAGYLEELLKYHIQKQNSETAVFVFEKLLLCYLNLRQTSKAKQVITELRGQPEILNHPRCVLIQADVFAFEDPQLAYSTYRTYTTKPYIFDSNAAFDWDKERFAAYPYMILCKLALALGQRVEASRYGREFIQRTSNAAKKTAIMDLLRSI